MSQIPARYEEAAAPDPALDRLVGRVMTATRGYHFSQQDVALIIGDALWQCAHAIRAGEMVEIPEIGTFRRGFTRFGLRIDFVRADGLLETNHVD